MCGVGHEVDTTIADLVADQRAATPSHAAQMLWTERGVLRQQADEIFLALTRGMDRLLDLRERICSAMRRPWPGIPRPGASSAAGSSLSA
jgi:exonuclease VII large subunit